MAEIEGVTGAGIVDVITFIVRHQTVIAGVIDAFKRERWPEFVTFRRVVIHHIQYHLDIGGVQGGNHLLELIYGLRRHILRMRRKETECVVPPEIMQSFVLQMPVIGKSMNGHQLNRCHAQGSDIFHNVRRTHAGKGSAQMLGNCRMAHGITANMRFVDQRFFPRNVSFTRASP